jgi:hypothetical protein
MSAPKYATAPKYGHVPDELKSRPQWVTWRRLERDGKPTKLPYDAERHSLADVTSPKTWQPFPLAKVAADLKGYDGVGYVFSARDPYTGIDLDHCRDKVTGAIELWAQREIDAFHSYSEISPSGEGVHIFVRATKPEGAGCRSPHVEVYDRERYFTVTGDHLAGSPVTIEPRQAELEAFLAAHILLGPTPETAPPRQTKPASLSVQAIIERAMTARNGAKFRALWNGDTTGYASASEADLALCSMLAFSAWGDAEAVDQCFRQSGLYREKWERDDYREATIAKAVETANGSRSQANQASQNGHAPHTFPPEPDTEALNDSEGMGKYGAGVVRLSDVQEKPLRWLWHPYYLRNKANVLEGDPGVGKSLLIALLTAVETTGQRMRFDTRPSVALGHPDEDDAGQDPGGTVVLLCGEDDTADTIKPRIVAAGGNCERVVVIEKLPFVETNKQGNEVTRYRRPRLPTDVDAITRVVRGERARLLMVDPLTSFLDKEVSPNSDTEIRSALDPLVDACAALDCSTLFTRHINKGSGQSALHRGAGSIGIAGLARSVTMVARDPDAPDGVEQHVFAHVKSNVARLGATLAMQKHVANPGDVPTIDWQGTSTLSADEVYQLLTQRLQGQSGEQRRERLGTEMSERLTQAVEWLKAEFARCPGEGLLSAPLLARAKIEARISEKDVRDAAAYLKVRQHRAGFQGPVRWHFDLPADA